MEDRLRREVRFLRAHALISTPILIVLALTAFRQGAQKTKFGEVDVERLNIVEKDGKLRMVISNRDRSIGPVYKGKPFGYPGGTRPGIIFFNDEETENGGLTFGGSRKADGSYTAGHHLSFDQYDQDQIVVLNYQDENGRRRMGLTISDRADVSIFDMVAQRDSIMKMPDGPAKTEALRQWQAPRNGVPLFAPRVYVGRDVSKAAVVNLSDRSGRSRLRLKVDSLGAPSLEFLDDSGRVTQRLPSATAAQPR